MSCLIVHGDVMLNLVDTCMDWQMCDVFADADFYHL